MQYAGFCAGVVAILLLLKTDKTRNLSQSPVSSRLFRFRFIVGSGFSLARGAVCHSADLCATMLSLLPKSFEPKPKSPKIEPRVAASPTGVFCFG